MILSLRVGCVRLARRNVALGADTGAGKVVLAPEPNFWMQLSRDKPAFVKFQKLNITSQIGQHGLGLGTVDPDCVDEQPHMCLVLRKDVFEPCPYIRLAAVGCTKRL